MDAERLISRLTAPAERLLVALTDPARRERAVIALLVAYVAVWTLYGVLAKSSQDLHSDMTEVVAWSRELALGYPKHPPLSAWIAAGWFAVFPAADWAFYLLAMTVAAIALWFVWLIAGDTVDDGKRPLALALLMVVPFFNFHALKYNANTILMPLWAATAFCFLRSYERRSTLWAALAGLCAAGAMLGKYWSVFLVLGLGLAALLDPRRAAYFRSAAPWVTAGVGTLVLAPHVAWLATHDFAPITYASAIRSGASANWLKSVGSYFAGAIGYTALPVAMAMAAIRPGRLVLRDMLWPGTPERRLVAAAFWLPLLLPALAAPVFGLEITSLWTMSAWTLLPIVLLLSPLIALDRRPVHVTVTVAVMLPFVMVLAAPLIASAIHRHGGTPAALHSRLLAERVAHEWRLVTDKPLRMVGGDGDLAYGVAFYVPWRASAFPDFNRKLAPWVDISRLAQDGIAIVCPAGDPGCPLPAEAMGLTGNRIEVEVARDHYGVAGQPGRYVVVIVPPRR